MTKAAQAAIHAGVDQMRGFRAIAATVLARYARDIASGWQLDHADEEHIHRICKRWQLADAFAAMYAGYKADLA